MTRRLPSGRSLLAELEAARKVCETLDRWSKEWSSFGSLATSDVDRLLAAWRAAREANK